MTAIERAAIAAVGMTHTTHPTPQQVRDWMQQRQAEHAPLPTPAEIRRQLGWNLVNKSAECAR